MAFKVKMRGPVPTEGPALVDTHTGDSSASTNFWRIYRGRMNIFGQPISPNHLTGRGRACYNV